MEEITKTYKVYSFSELKPEIQAKVLDANRLTNVDYEDWHDYITEGLTEDMKAAGITFEQVYFDADRDNYAYLDKPKVIDYLKLFKAVGIDARKKPYNLIKDNWQVAIETRYYGGGQGKNYIDLTIENLAGSEEYNKIDEPFNAWLEERLNKFLKDITTAYNELTENDAVKETIEANERKFLENGKPFTEGD